MSRREQIRLLVLIALSLPVYFATLELPVVIVNEGILGEAFHHSKTARLFEVTIPLPQSLGGKLHVFEGLELGQLAFLLTSCAAFLVLILLHAGFKYVLERQKGRIATAVNQHLQETVTANLLASAPSATASLKSGEIVSVLRADIEPVGNFAGQAFGTPLVQVGHAAVALVFISLQSPILGTLAAATLVVQFWIVPRLGEHEVHLQAARREVGRRLGGRLGEVVEALPAIRAEGVVAYEHGRMREELGRYAAITLEAQRWGALTYASMAGFAQLSRLAMFMGGGLLTFFGSLMIGNLVAVLNAFREMPEAAEELLKWHHKLHDIEERYARLPTRFGSRPSRREAAEQPPHFACGHLKANALVVENARGVTVIDGLDLTVPLPAHIGLIDSGGEAARSLAAVLAGEMTPSHGYLRLASTRIEELAPDLVGRELGYVPPNVPLFDATLRTNVAYGLYRRPPPGPGGDWTDFERAGVDGPEALDARIIDLLQAVGLGPDLYAAGLGSPLARAPDPDTGARIVASRVRLRAALDEQGLSELVEPFNPDHFLENGTLLENILFGRAHPSAPLRTGELLRDRGFAALLRDSGLTARLAETGRSIAGQLIAMYETGAGDAIPDSHARLLSERDVPAAREALRTGDEAAAMRIAFRYCETRHRLGLVDDALRSAVLAVRGRAVDALAPSLRKQLHVYDAKRFCEAASFRDNLLFGRVVQRIAGAGRKVDQMLAQTLGDLDLTRDVYRAALELPAGAGGRLLDGQQKALLCLARALLKRPSALVVNLDIEALPPPRRASLLDSLRREMQGKTLVVVCGAADTVADFDTRISFDGARLRAVEEGRRDAGLLALDLAG